MNEEDGEPGKQDPSPDRAFVVDFSGPNRDVAGHGGTQRKIGERHYRGEIESHYAAVREPIERRGDPKE